MFDRDSKLIWENYKTIIEAPVDDISIMGFDREIEEKDHGYDQGSIKGLSNPRDVRDI